MVLNSMALSNNNLILFHNFMCQKFRKVGLRAGSSLPVADSLSGVPSPKAQELHETVP